MEEKNYTGTVPVNLEGGIINAESSADAADASVAAELFQTAKARLLDVNHWQELAGEALAGFELTDRNGEKVSGPVQEGYYFKIDIPGPGTKAGEGYDWVKVEEIKEYNTDQVDSMGIRVRPAANPTSGEDATAHFYSEDSTSTFTVTREGTKITVAIYDRNTKPNPDSAGVIDQVRNSLVGVAGKYAFSKIQWKSLANGIIKQTAHE